MKQGVWTKSLAAKELRALANAIDATVIPERIEQHVRELGAMSRVILRKELYTNQYWLNN